MKSINIIGLILFAGLMGHLSVTSFISMIDNLLLMDIDTGARWAGLWTGSTYLAYVAILGLIHEVKKTLTSMEV